MGSDRARVSYDEGRGYRSVVAQQGRVTLEADVNEAWAIAEREQAERTLDVVGASGTPDDGYRVSGPPAGGDAFDLVVGPGTMYVGGERAVAAADILYSDQDEWLDRSTDADWVDPDSPASTGKANELVWLWLSDVEVGAVEDHALRDVALGGPDTAQRGRLVQRIKRFATDARTCRVAFKELADELASRGFHLDFETRRALPDATLEVSFPPGPATPDLCEPEAAGGYLEADNQLIRVEVTAWDGSQGKLVWGFDNASFLYRVTPVNAQTLELQSRPVDAEHQPAAGQAIEVLRSAARLTPQDYVASPTGVVQTLALAYNPDTQQVVLSNALPADYLDPVKTPVMFLRAWQQEITFTPGIPVSLGTTGVQVTVDAPAGTTFAPGAYWMFAVRPSTPQKVYPERYLDGPQPAEGPALWATPLAVVSPGQKLQVLEDCRDPFDNLVELSRRRTQGCCDVVVTPEQVNGGRSLQALIDRYEGKPVTICLRPGRYELREPLRLGPRHEGLTLEGCHDGVVLTAARAAQAKFVMGLVVLDRAENVTIKGIRFLLPRVPFTEAKATFAGRDRAELREMMGERLDDLDVSVGIRPMHSAMLTVRDCLFRFTLSKGRDIFGAGIFAGAESWGHHVEDCRFLRDEEYMRNEEPRFRMLFGYLTTPSSATQKAREGKRATSGRTVPALLAESSFLGNRFTGLSAGIAAVADFGPIRIDDNSVRESQAGFVLASMRSFLAARMAGDFQKSKGSTAKRSLTSTMATDLVQIGLAIARAYPTPEGFAPDHALEVTSKGDARRRRSTNEHLTAMLTRSERVRTVNDFTGRELEPSAVDTAQPAPAAESWKSLDDDVASVEAARFDEPPVAERGLRLQLHVGDNDVDAVVQAAPSAAALIVMDDVEDTGSNITVVGNRMRSAAEGLPAAVVWLVDSGSVTGNTIANEEGGGSISIYTGSAGKEQRSEDRVAVAGNFFRGYTVIPPRDYPSPMDNWDVLNAIV